MEVSSFFQELLIFSEASVFVRHIFSLERKNPALLRGLNVKQTKYCARLFEGEDTKYQKIL